MVFSSTTIRSFVRHFGGRYSEASSFDSKERASSTV
jgi:hypothetical protein